MRFLHTADWQLGMTRHFLAGDAQPRYSAARRDAVAGLGALAAEVGAEFVVVAGDVFEHNQLAPQVIGQSLEAMRAIGIPVYLLPGNHDPLDASSVYTGAAVHLGTPGQRHRARPGRRPRGSPGRGDRRGALAVQGAHHRPGRRGARRLARGRRHPGAGRHGGVDSLDPDRDKPSLIRLADVETALARGVMHYVALGDKHSRTQVGDSGRVWYSGSPEVTNYRRRRGRPRSCPGRRHRRKRSARPVRVDARHVGRWRFVTLRSRWTPAVTSPIST